MGGDGVERARVPARMREGRRRPGERGIVWPSKGALLRRLAVPIIVTCWLAAGCGPGGSSESPGPAGSGPRAGAPAPSPRRAPESTEERTSGSARCRGVESGATLAGDAGAILARALSDQADLPAGWTAASPAVAPPADEPLFVVASAAWAPFCAGMRAYDTPEGRLRVLVAVFDDPPTAAAAGARMNAARGAGVAPAISSRRHVTLLAPGDRSTAEAWAAAGNKKAGARDIDLLAQAAEIGDAVTFRRLFDARVASHPSDAMPWAYRAGLESRRGEFDAAKASAREALQRAAGDPEAQAEAFHWASYAEYSSGASNAVVSELTERGVTAARASNNPPMLMRALFDRACSHSVGGRTRLAFEDLRESLALEAQLGGRHLRDTARTEVDLEAARQLPEVRDLLKE